MARTSASRKKNAPAGASPAPDAGVPVYVLCGDDDYRIDREARKLVDALCPEDRRALALEMIEGNADHAEHAVRLIRDTVDALCTLGFMGAEKTVWLRRPNFLGGTTTASNDDVKAGVARLAERVKNGLPAGHQLVISAVKFDKRSALYKACAQAGRVHEFNAPDARNLAGEVTRQFEERGIRARGDLVEEFLDKTGSDTRLIHSEIEKLDLYLGERRELTAQDLSLMVVTSRETMGWDYTEAVGRRRPAQALDALRRLLFHDAYASIPLIYMLENRFREILILKECVRRKWLAVESRGWKKEAVWSKEPACVKTMESIFPEKRKNPYHMHPYRVLILLEQAEAYSRAEVFEAIDAIARAHEQLVSSRLPKNILMELLTIQLAAA